MPFPGPLWLQACGSKPNLWTPDSIPNQFLVAAEGRLGYSSVAFQPFPFTGGASSHEKVTDRLPGTAAVGTGNPPGRRIEKAADGPAEHGWTTSVGHAQHAEGPGRASQRPGPDPDRIPKGPGQERPAVRGQRAGPGGERSSGSAPGIAQEQGQGATRQCGLYL